MNYMHIVTECASRDEKISRHLCKMSLEGWELVSTSTLPSKLMGQSHTIAMFWKKPLRDYQELSS